MISSRLRTAALGIAGFLALAGCESYYDPYDSGYGRVSLGYGSGYYGGGYYGSRYYDPYYWGRDYRQRYYSDRYYRPYSGWNNGYYYPGTGIFVYDRYRRAHRWSDSQRRHWEGRRHNRQDRVEHRKDRWKERWNDRVDRRRDRRRDRDD